MNIQNNVNLQSLNTFAISAVASNFVIVNSPSTLHEIGNHPQLQERKIIGGGSNILFTKDPEALIICNRLKGIEQLKETEEYVYLSVASGEIWHDFVLHSLDQNLSGIENLALIPGTVGAAPIQNIGAYGVEVKDTIESVTYWSWEEKKLITLTNSDCQFGYRDSIFKSKIPNQFFITSVVFKLYKNANLHTGYGAIQEELNNQNISNPTPKEVANAVIAIRSSKLPDPKKIGNAGSFFKNPTIPKSDFEALKESFPNIPSFPVSEQQVKIPAAWMIEQCGWKGFRENDFGVHALQALVLVNYGQANGQDLLSLSDKIIHSVNEQFGIMLEREVQIW